MEQLYADDYFVVHRDDARRIILVTRTEFHGQAEGVLQSMRAAIDNVGMGHSRGYGLVIDTRKAIGRNEESFEERSSQSRRALQARFPKVAIVVGTVVGQMQAQRMSRDEGDSAPLITTDLDRAVAYVQ